MTDYLPSFIVEPVLRQARRLSRLSSNEETPGFLPSVPESLRTWYPTRLWNTSPPVSITEDEHHQEGTLQQIARNIQLWTNQIPSPPLEPMDVNSITESGSPAPHTERVTDVSSLEPELVPHPRPVRLEESGAESETSQNPLRELSGRSRFYEDGERGNSHSDPAWGTRSRGQTIVQPSAGPEPANNNEYNNDDLSRRRDGSSALPEDDGMGPLRQRISAIWVGDGLPAEKSRLIHALMMERYRLTQVRAAISRGSSHNQIEILDRPGSPMSPASGVSREAVYSINSSDLVPTYAPIDVDELIGDGEDKPMVTPKPELGCEHYRRNVKIQCNDCERWYTCRLCHDESSGHVLPRRQTKHMLCMLCNTPQPAAQACRMCGEIAASYYCSVCKLWSNDPRKSIYHCDDCGICRLGQGIGKDFFHCKTCAACMSIQAEATHRCIEKSTQCDCPICGEYLFTSNKSVAFMNCGHSIHETCFADWCNSSYKCPICSKSITNMESQFRRLDRHIAEQPMPDEYKDTKAYIFCNDCSSRSTTKYHWLGLRCERCESYNTAQLQLLGPVDPPRPASEEVEEPTSSAMLSDNTADSIAVEPTAAGNASSRGGNVAHSPESQSFLSPHLPPNRSVRSVSPIVGSYFDNDRREVPRRSTPMEDHEHLDFWGVQSRTSNQPVVESGSSSEEVSSSSDEIMEDDDGEEEDEVEDALDLIGHR